MNDATSEPAPSERTALMTALLDHMKVQNNYQQQQLVKGDNILRQLNGAKYRANILLVAAVVLLGLCLYQQVKIREFVVEQQQSRERYQALEKSVASATAEVSARVEQFEKLSPKVVTDSKGDLSLSVPVSAAAAGALSAQPKPKSRLKKALSKLKAPPSPIATAQDVAPAASGFTGTSGVVLVPLERSAE